MCAGAGRVDSLNHVAGFFCPKSNSDQGDDQQDHDRAEDSHRDLEEPETHMTPVVRRVSKVVTHAPATVNAKTIVTRRVAF